MNSLLEAVHPDDRGGAADAWTIAVSNGTTYEHECRVDAGVRGWIWTLAFATAFKDDQGSVVKWIGMNIDISARKAIEQAVEDAGRQRNEFISILAHELRNPLAPLRSGIDMMLNPTATSSARVRALALMNRQICHLSRLVDDLVDASRITTGRLQVHLQKVRLLEALRNSVENIQPAMRARRLAVVINVPEDIDPIIDADPVRLNQAFVNVLNNSVKFSPEGSQIDITVCRQDEQVSVIFRDRGREIPESDRSKIFELFVQSARHDSGDGLGIGLALARDIVTLHRGFIETRNPPDGVGVEFDVLLPVVAFNSEEAERLGDDLAQTAAHSLRVLVADDNVDAAEALGALLEMSGQTVRIAHDGLRAVEEAAAFLPEVIFMDVGMPVMGGLEATRLIRAANHSVRPLIVALTGWSSEADRAASKEAGCDFHMAKPAVLEDILATVERARTNS